jgi:SSS family solute:Na+ symporter
MVNWVLASWLTVIPTICAFAIFALGLTFYLQKRNGLKNDPDFFVTARHSASTIFVAWSFYSGALGSWVVVSPPNYASFAGLIGLSMYALATGLPLLLVAVAGNYAQTKYPDVTSSADFFGKRFGVIAQTLFVVLCVFNMGVAMTAEYTTMASLFYDFVGTVAYPEVIVSGVLTLMYTAYGGLFVSIVTDQFQGIFSTIILVTLTVYVAVTFREPLPTPLDEYLKGTTVFGYSSILTQPLALTAGTVFSEAVWQKAWASQNKKSLYIGAALATVATIITVFMFGFGGFLATWAGLIDFENTNPNLYLFQVFDSQRNSDNPAQLSSWVSLITLVSAAVMSQSAVDSIQNGLMGTFNCYFLKYRPLWVTRVFVVLINIPSIVVGLKRYNVLSMFLVANMLCATALVPFLAGFVEQFNDWYSGDHVWFAFVFGFLFTSGYGVGKNWVPGDFGASLQQGFWYTWYGNQYTWQYFAVAVASSVAGMAIAVLLGLFFRKVLRVTWASPTEFVMRFAPYFAWISGTAPESKKLEESGIVGEGDSNLEDVELNDKREEQAILPQDDIIPVS